MNGRSVAAAAAAAGMTNNGKSGSYQSDPPIPSLLLTRPTTRGGRGISVLTCSKLCGICFVGGIIVGFTLKRRLRRWAARLLRRIKDD